MTTEEKTKLADIFSWLDYEFNISEHYEEDITVDKLKKSYRIADNKIGELFEMLGFDSFLDLEIIDTSQ